MRFRDRVAIVTGSARGIAAATARARAQEGGRVPLLDVDEPATELVARDAARLGGEAVAIRADVTRGGLAMV